MPPTNQKQKYHMNSSVSQETNHLFSNSQVIRTLIIDDYLEAIENLKDLLREFHEVEIVGEATGVEEGIRQIICKKPHLLFLDVEMPGKSGLDLINELIKHRITCPKVIFTTAFGHYAIEALRSNAIDYLLKPIDVYELTMAIQRYKNVRTQDDERQKLESFSKSLGKSKRILLPTITGLKQIPLANVMYFQKENDVTEHVKIYYSTSHCETIPGSILLKQVIQMLPPEDFFQIDRRTVIHLDCLTDIETKSRICVLSKCGEQVRLPISRGRLKAFREVGVI